MVKVKNKKLQISLKGLTDKQVKKINRYAKFASHTKQDVNTIGDKIKKQVSKYKSSNIANAKKKYYSTGLGVYKLRQKLDTQWNFYEGRTKIKGKKWKDLTPRQQLAFKKQNEKLWLKYLRWNARRKAVSQIKEDRKSAYENAKAQLARRVVEYKHGVKEASETWWVHRSTEESYRLNETTQTSKEQIVDDLYGSNSEYLEDIEEMGYSNATDKWFKIAIKEGLIEELAQGVAWGYITSDYSEVISPP